MKHGLLLGSAFALMTVVTAFAGGHEGGGGAGICLNDNCKTLAETGFRLADETSDDFEIDDVTLDALDDIIQELPEWLKSYINRSTVIGRKGSIISLEIQNPERVNDFIQEYKKLILKQSPDFDFSNFELLGFTLEDNTYLIMNKFKKMKNPQSKAILLMHEMYIREYRSSVANALRVDGMILDYLKAKNTNSLQTFDFWNFYNVLGSAKVIYQTYANSMMIAYLIDNGMPVEDFAKTVTYAGSSQNPYIIYDQSLDLRKYNKNFAKDLGGEYFHAPKISRNNILIDVIKKALTKAAASLKAPKKNFTVTAKDINEAFKETLKVYPSYGALSACKGKNDVESRFGTWKLDEDSSLIEDANCDLAYSFNGYDAFYEGVEGYTFNFPGSIECTKEQSTYITEFRNCRKK